MLRQSAALRAIVRPAVVGKEVRMGMGLGQKRAAHAISNPTLANIEKRWEGLPPQEQADLWMALRDRMKVNWAELTLQEKKAAYYIAFGAHGPRAQEPPNEGWKVFGYVCAGIGATFVLFSTIRMFAKGGPSTMNKEYQEATNEYLKAQNSEPISGISSEGYSGPGMVQSAPKAK
ncbi:Cytochrome c oxidase polypeptide 5, mitochondrial [Cadophora sp. M221]|nr:Cytochrome c oxidase polypeptide 5, mitochondrial [Cadophora sp. M221]